MLETAGLSGSYLLDHARLYADLIQENNPRKRSDESIVLRSGTCARMAASIAHEVNQPITGMVTNANASLRWMAGDSPNLVEAGEAIRRIVRDGILAGDVISRLRALFKKTYTVKERLNINEAIEEVVILTESELWRNEVALRLELAADLLSVMGDRVQLQQAIVNLILNAIQAMSVVEDRERDLIIRTHQDNPTKSGLQCKTRVSALIQRSPNGCLMLSIPTRRADSAWGSRSVVPLLKVTVDGFGPYRTTARCHLSIYTFEKSVEPPSGLKGDSSELCLRLMPGSGRRVSTLGFVHNS